MHNQKRIWSELSDSEREKVRAALKEVWSDSQVLSARASVNQAVEEYQVAIREAITNQDPETAQLLEKIKHDGLLSTMGEGHKRGMKKHHRPFEQIRLFPHIVEKLSETEATAFKDASEKVSKLPEVTSSWEQLKKLRQENETINQRQSEAIRNFRRIYLEKVVEHAAELKGKIDLDEASSPKMGGKGKGRSKGGKGHRPHQNKEQK